MISPFLAFWLRNQKVRSSNLFGRAIFSILYDVVLAAGHASFPMLAVDFIGETVIGFPDSIARNPRRHVMSRQGRAMGRIRSNASPTDLHARRIATAIAKSRPPAFSPDLQLYLESFPGEIFAALKGAARHMPPTGKDEALALGYLFLLQGLLEHLRYRADSGYADATGLIAEFQAAVVAQAEAGHIDGLMLAFVAGALQQSKMPTSLELAAVLAKQNVDDGEGGQFPADVGAAVVGMLDACGGDPFVIVGSLAEVGHAMSGEARVTLAATLAASRLPSALGATVLFLLDPDPAVRRAAGGVLAEVASSLSSTDVRRLIAMRNWRPEDERAGIDAVVRKARAAGIDCAPWEVGAVETILASAIDGTAAQGFMLLSPAGRKKRMSSILIKGGIADAWSAEPETRRRIEVSLADASLTAPMLAVSRSYLDRVVAHHLALGVEKGQAPRLGLLQVAETIGGADWQPARTDFGETLSGLIAEIPGTMRESASVKTALRKSDELADIEVVAQSWFEDDPEIAQIAAGGRGAGRARLATYLLQTAFARRRDKWADLFLRTASWLREASPEGDLCWRELVIVAKAVVDGRDLSEIGLMRDIALRTIAALRHRASGIGSAT